MSHDAEAGEITRLLHLAAAGDADADERVFSLAYDELRRLARSLLRGNGAATIEPTALVSEAFLRLGNRHAIDWQDRHHFYAIAARAMRRVLIDQARARLAIKRAGAVVTLTDAPVVEAGSETIVAVDEALVSLAALSPRQAKVVEMRWFAGFDVEDTAAALGVSTMTVKRDWAAARAFLAHALAQRDM
jgi:RNA polymerase sigma factor (TIGR02999 family)